MSDSEWNEYDVVSVKAQPGTLSLLCSIVPLTWGYYADKLPWWFPPEWRYRAYVGALVVAVTVAVVGLALGLYATRRPETRTLGRLGVLVNSTALVLEGLYVYGLYWIFNR